MSKTVVGEFEFDSETGELIRGEDVVRLRPHAASALALLVERAGGLVARQELCDRIWPRGGVELDLGLNVCIRQIRVALGDDAEAPRYVETLRGRGYRLIAEVRPSKPTARATVRTRSVRSAGVRILIVVTAVATLLLVGTLVRRGVGTDPLRIAVLPFTAEGATESLDSLGRALGAELITTLATRSTPELAVIARTSSFAAGSALMASLADGVPRPDSSEAETITGGPVSALAARLDADYVVSGTLRPARSRFSVTAHLVDTHTRLYVWTERFVVSEPELAALHDRIADRVGEVLPLAPAASSPRPLDPEVRLALFSARHLLDRLTRDDAGRALEMLEEALARDTAASQLWVEESRARLALGQLDESRRAVDRARALRGDDPEIDHAEARLALFGLDEPAVAVALLERAVIGAPGVAEFRHTYALALARTGELERAAEEGERALELDPLSATVNGDVGWIFYRARRFDRALETCGVSAELQTEPSGARACRILAAHATERLPEVAEDGAASVLELGGTPAQAQAAREGLQRSDPIPLAAWLDTHATGVGLDLPTRARVKMLLGRPEEALDLIASAIGASDQSARLVRDALDDPLFSPIREHALFEATAEHLGRP